MRPLPRSILGICILVPAFSAHPTTVQCQPASLWDHNNSVMALYADGASRVFRYHEPRIGMQLEGVVSGSLLLDRKSTRLNSSH